MPTSRVVVTAVAMSVTAAAVEAQNSTHPVTLTSARYKVAYNGVYVGPYTAAVPGMPTLDVFCVDHLHSISVGYQWIADFTSLGSILADKSLLSRPRWGSV